MRWCCFCLQITGQVRLCGQIWVHQKCGMGRKGYMACLKRLLLLKLHHVSIFELVFRNLPLLAQKVNLCLHLFQHISLLLIHFPFIFELLLCFKKRFFDTLRLLITSKNLVIFSSIFIYLVDIIDTYCSGIFAKICSLSCRHFQRRKHNF